jgi:mannose-6-phosphate isomerase-like protein (cupin superfamily)
MTLSVSEKLLEVREHDKDGYSPLVDFESWRVAILNFSNDLLPENIKAMQRHNETDEVFVLLAGRCILFIGDGNKEVTDIFAENMQPFKIYNVKKSVWHSHTLSRDAKVLIVENRDTTFDNSPFSPLTDTQRKKISDITLGLWGEQDL